MKGQNDFRQNVSEIVVYSRRRLDVGAVPLSHIQNMEWTALAYRHKTTEDPLDRLYVHGIAPKRDTVKSTECTTFVQTYSPRTIPRPLGHFSCHSE